MSYQVEEVKAREQRTTKAGKPFTKYLLSLVDEGDQRFEVPFADFQNVNPSPGDKLDGYQIADEGFGKELRKVGSGNGAKPRPGRSPEETKAIVRQHSQEMAIRTLALRPGSGNLEPDKLREAIKRWTDWFQEDATS